MVYSHSYVFVSQLTNLKPQGRYLQQFNTISLPDKISHHSAFWPSRQSLGKCLCSLDPGDPDIMYWAPTVAQQ